MNKNFMKRVILNIYSPIFKEIREADVARGVVGEGGLDSGSLRDLLYIGR